MGLKQAYMIYTKYKEMMIISVEILYTMVHNYFSNKVMACSKNDLRLHSKRNLFTNYKRSSILFLVFNCLRINLSIWRRDVRTLIITVVFSVELFESHNMGLDLVASCFEHCEIFIVPSI